VSSPLLLVRAPWVRCLPLALLVGCVAAPPQGQLPLPGASPRTQVPRNQPPSASRPIGGAGLDPLPTPQQVVNALSLGRRDPFGGVGPAPVRAEVEAAVTQSGTGKDSSGAAAVNAPPAAQARRVRPGPLQLPSGFRLTGMIQSGGQSQALVELGTQAGPLCVGQRGFCPGAGAPPLLPPGWTVASIDVARGQLVLGRAGRWLTTRI
jgi:hypothetical protein